MLPCRDHIESSSPPCKQCLPGKNGFHKRPGNTGEESCSSENSLGSFLFVESLREQDLNKFHTEGEKLVKILEKDPKNLEAVSKFVQNYKDVSVTWKNSECYLRLCDLDGPVYMGQEYMQEAWEDLYLPKITRMQVFGMLQYNRHIPAGVPWVILVGEDGCIYAYGDEELQLIAKSLQEFVKNGKKKFYEAYQYPECSDEEDESLQQDEEIMKIRQRGKDFVEKSAEKIDHFLNYFASLS